MAASMDRETISLEARGMHTIVHGAGLSVACRAGAIWLTQEHDGRDITLRAGDTFTLDRDGLAVVYALQEATFSVAVAAPLPARAEPFRSVPQIRAA
jgi:hypothetical protein